MTDTTIPPIVLRTTSDGDAYAHGLVLGLGPTPAMAADQLAREAQERARMIDRGPLEARRAARAGGVMRSIPPESTAGPERWYEVADVRLTPDPAAEDPSERWVAYGTLRSSRQRPGSGGCWSAGSLD